MVIDQNPLQVDDALVGLLIDSKERLAVAVLSVDTVGVTLTRMDATPTPEALDHLLREERWLAVGRKTGPSIFLIEPYAGQDGPSVYNLTTPEDRETAQFAIEVALHSWPEWCPELRGQITPRWPIPIYPEGREIEA